MLTRRNKARDPAPRRVDLWGLAHPVGGRLDHVTSDRPGHQKLLPLVWQVAGASPVREVRLADGSVVPSRAELASAHDALGAGNPGDTSTASGSRSRRAASWTT